MFKLIRRISSSMTGLWNEDSSESAPQVGRKRRLDDDDDDDMSGTLSKRSKNAHITVPGPLLEEDEDEFSQGSSGDSPATSPVKETEGVRDVTKGVKGVELEKNETKEDTADAPEASDNAEDAPKVNGTTTEAPIASESLTEGVSNESSEANKIPYKSEESQGEKVEDEAPSSVLTTPIPQPDATPADIKNPLPTPTKEVEVSSSRADRPIKPLKRSRKADLNGATPEPALVGKRVNGEAKIANGTAVEEPVAVAH